MFPNVTRRIIANKTAIDIAGSSMQVIKFSSFVNTSVEINDNSNLNENFEDVITYSVLHNNNHYEHVNNNKEERNDNILQILNLDNINDNNNEEAFGNDIAEWSIKYNIRHNACNALLRK